MYALLCLWLESVLGFQRGRETSPKERRVMKIKWKNDRWRFYKANSALYYNGKVVEDCCGPGSALVKDTVTRRTKALGEYLLYYHISPDPSERGWFKVRTAKLKLPIEFSTDEILTSAHSEHELFNWKCVICGGSGCEFCDNTGHLVSGIVL